MFNSSVIARRLLKSRTQAIVVLAQKRMMSSSSALLVPLQEKEQLPFELRSTDLTDAEFDKIQTAYREFNAKCSDELKEMNQNRITNIIERGGVEGWDTVSTLMLILFEEFRPLIFLIFSAATPSARPLRLNISSRV